jgi:glycosyltransferase involved in cell wall biosynthesis
MNVTVILCTYNRCHSLAEALESIAASVMPTDISWEVLIVDNNSSDQTQEVAQEYCRRYQGTFRYLFEPRQGKSNALNSGIRESCGSVLAFMDDDVIVAPDWLANLTRELHAGRWVGAGGRILARHTLSVPDWLPMDGPHSLSGMLALFDLGDKPCRLERSPFGTNMAFQKAIFDKYGDFRTDLGPCPGSEIRNEDTEFGRRLLNDGELLRYEPSAVVYHAIPESRLTQEYLLAFWYDLGRASVREMEPRPDILGIPRHYLTMLKTIAVLGPACTLKWITAFNRQSRFYWKGWVWKTAGEISELYRRSFAWHAPANGESIARTQKPGR